MLTSLTPLQTCCPASSWLLHVFQTEAAAPLLILMVAVVNVLGVSHEPTDSTPILGANLSQIIANETDWNPSDPSTNLSRLTEERPRSSNKGVHRAAPEGDGIPREFPTALVIASSVAAVCILVFFVVAYFWHTHQLDSRARKLAIRLAADAEHSMRCHNCRSHNNPGVMSSSVPTTTAAASASGGDFKRLDISHEHNHYEAVSMEEEDRGLGSDGRRSSAGLSGMSESEAGDSEDMFEPTSLTQTPARGGRGGGRGGRGAHRKWSRSRKSSGPPGDGKRHSGVTDKDILTHFASRRHSTFFI